MNQALDLSFKTKGCQEQDIISLLFTMHPELEHSFSILYYHLLI